MRGHASLTARHVAAKRLRLDRPSGPHGDPDADRRLQGSLGRFLALPASIGVPMTERTEFYDGQLQQAIARGVTQIVILGAGYDGRALRFADPGVRFFEVDHPVTQADKLRRLQAVRADVGAIAFVAVDFSTDDLPAGLSAAGFDTAAPALFILEGVLPYLDVAVIDRLFRSVREVSSPDSVFALNARVRLEVTAPTVKLLRTGFDALLSVIGEPRRMDFRPGDVERLLAQTGWHVSEAATTTDRDSEQSYGTFVIAQPIS